MEDVIARGYPPNKRGGFRFPFQKPRERRLWWRNIMSETRTKLVYIALGCTRKISGALPRKWRMFFCKTKSKNRSALPYERSAFGKGCYSLNRRKTLYKNIFPYVDAGLPRSAHRVRTEEDLKHGACSCSWILNFNVIVNKKTCEASQARSIPYGRWL